MESAPREIAVGRGGEAWPSRRTFGWIVSARQDLMWFQGSVLAGVLFLVLFLALPRLDPSNYALGHPVLLAIALWGICFDGTHVWGTYARSYCAPDEASRASLPGNWSWLVFLVGPAIALLDFWLIEPSTYFLGKAGWLYLYFLVGAFLWAYYHLVRQHYGFMVLYRRKEADPSDRNLDTLFLWAGSLYAYLLFSFTDAYAATGLPHVVPTAWFPNARMVLHVLFALTMLWLILQTYGRGRPPAFGPKHLLLAIVVGFHLLVFTTLENLLVILATLTIYHNLQYHRIVWQYERGKKRVPMGSVLLYLSIGLAFGLIWYVPRILGPAATGSYLIRNVLIGYGWGFAFHHYILDARIWRVRRDPGVAQTLEAGT